MRRRLVLAAGLIIGLLFVYGAVGDWIGVAQAVGAPRTAGVVRDVQCGYRGACSGAFTGGAVAGEHVVVRGARPQAAAQPATLVRRIPNGLDGAIQSDDTAYVGAVTLNVVPDVLIGVLLSVVGLIITLPYVLIGALYLLRRPSRRA